MVINLVQKSRLFKGMSEDQVSETLSFLHAQERQFKKGDVLMHAGDVTERLGLVLEGSVTIESNDAWGNRTILSHVGPGQLFAETYALLEDEPLLVDVVANEACQILFLHIGGAHRLMSVSKAWATKFTANMLMISSLKNLHLAERSFHITSSTEHRIRYSVRPAATCGLSECGTDCVVKGTGENAEGRLDQSQEESLYNINPSNCLKGQ